MCFYKNTDFKCGHLFKAELVKCKEYERPSPNHIIKAAKKTANAVLDESCPACRVTSFEF